MGQDELRGVRVRRGHGDADPADADPGLGTDLQQLESQGAAGGGGQPGVGEAEAAERGEQDVSEGREPQPE